jgi:Cu+-exporting ATPase
MVRLGSAQWLGSLGVDIPSGCRGASVYCAQDLVLRGGFILENKLRPEIEKALRVMADSRRVVLLSGDNARQQPVFEQVLGTTAELHFNQAPADKLEFVRRLQREGNTVLMAGDGLNDAGALKQSNVGVAVVEEAGIFSPASDAIVPASAVAELPNILEFARRATRIVRLSFGISALYNLAGISIASLGVLSPLICAVLMPLSSVSVVLFACGATKLAARRAGLSR